MSYLFHGLNCGDWFSFHSLHQGCSADEIQFSEQMHLLKVFGVQEQIKWYDLGWNEGVSKEYVWGWFADPHWTTFPILKIQSTDCIENYFENILLSCLWQCFACGDWFGFGPLLEGCSTEEIQSFEQNHQLKVFGVREEIDRNGLAQYEGVSGEGVGGRFAQPHQAGIGQAWSLSRFKVSRQLPMNDLNYVSSVSFIMTASTALANEGLFELTQLPSLTRAISLSLEETTEVPGCSQVKRLKFDQI